MTGRNRAEQGNFTSTYERKCKQKSKHASYGSHRQLDNSEKNEKIYKQRNNHRM